MIISVIGGVKYNEGARETTVIISVIGGVKYNTRGQL